ncbi:hypothetical protein [Paludibacterium denitrificans]|uniref:hypothetical protein n=1 Tax=Paludibacterium denitrificans TaxID=2675226 RepID=UPI001E4A2541|nr:hypothetical protein [Paludibacterium denitrificans]
MKQSEPNRKACALPDIVEAALSIAEIESRLSKVPRSTCIFRSICRRYSSIPS